MTALITIDQLVASNPAQLIRFLEAGRKLWAGNPGSVVVWRDDLIEEHGVPAIVPPVMAFWRRALQGAPWLPFAVVAGGRCMTELVLAHAPHVLIHPCKSSCRLSFALSPEDRANVLEDFNQRILSYGLTSAAEIPALICQMDAWREFVDREFPVTG
jgi:hypothetical protein